MHGIEDARNRGTSKHMPQDKQKHQTYNEFSNVMNVYTYHYLHWKHADLIIVPQILIGIQMYKMTLNPLI